MKLKEVIIYRALPELDRLLDFIETTNKHMFIAGSFALWMTQKEATFIPNDIDIWFRDNTTRVHYTRLMERDFDIELLNSTDRADTYRLKTNNPELDIKLQFLKTYYGTPEDVLNKFDIDNCKIAIFSKTKAKSISTFTPNKKRLRLSDNINNSYNTALRMFKYNRRGFEVDLYEIDYLIKSFVGKDKSSMLLEAEQNQGQS